MANIPYGAVAMAGYADKLAGGLQQFMAGARKTAAETGIAYMTEAQNEKAIAILKK